ncbi:hypothetical protein KFE25_004377, partial [Diacronema lutheri]
VAGGEAGARSVAAAGLGAAPPCRSAPPPPAAQLGRARRAADRGAIGRGGAAARGGAAKPQQGDAAVAKQASANSAPRRAPAHGRMPGGPNAGREPERVSTMAADVGA